MSANPEHVFNNIAYATLKEAATASDTVLYLTDGSGYAFRAAWSSGKIFYLTLTDKLKNIEIVKVTSVSGDALTVERGQDGTVARAWPRGSLISQRLVAANLDGFIQKEGFRTIDYNPNDSSLAANYPGEKVYQTGAEECQKRWWKHRTGTKWRLIAGEPCSDEEYDDDGYVVAAPTWIQVYDNTYWDPIPDTTWGGEETGWIPQGGGGINLEVKGTWFIGFRPTKMRLTIAEPNSPPFSTRLYDWHLYPLAGPPYICDASFDESGEEISLTFQGEETDYDIFQLNLESGSSNLTNIEFYGYRW